MELNFTELDNNINTKNPYETFDYNGYNNETNINPEKYWEQNKPQTKKKKVSFDDILSNMNLVVNKSGVLQFMSQQPKIEEPYQEPYQEIYKQPYEHQYQEQIHVKKIKEPLDSSVKHSYIYNKYFKDYQDVAPKEPQIRVPKTIEEYRQMLLEDKIKMYEQRKKINEIKSTKLLFTSNREYGEKPNPIHMRSSRNSLRMMNFK